MANGYAFEAYNAQLTVHAACENNVLHIICKLTWYPQNTCKVVPNNGTTTIIQQGWPINVTHFINSLGVNSHFLSVVGDQPFSMTFCVVNTVKVRYWDTMLPSLMPTNLAWVGALYCTISCLFKQRRKSHRQPSTPVWVHQCWMCTLLSNHVARSKLESDVWPQGSSSVTKLHRLSDWRRQLRLKHLTRFTSFYMIAQQRPCSD